MSESWRNSPLIWILSPFVYIIAKITDWQLQSPEIQEHSRLELILEYQTKLEKELIKDNPNQSTIKMYTARLRGLKIQDDKRFQLEREIMRNCAEQDTADMRNGFLHF